MWTKRHHNICISLETHAHRLARARLPQSPPALFSAHLCRLIAARHLIQIPSPPSLQRLSLPPSCFPSTMNGPFVDAVVRTLGPLCPTRPSHTPSLTLPECASMQALFSFFGPLVSAALLEDGPLTDHINLRSVAWAMSMVARRLEISVAAYAMSILYGLIASFLLRRCVS